MYSPNRAIHARRVASILATIAVVFGLGACVGSPTTRLGMVKNPETGLMIGSRVEKTIITDASFHKNKKIKVRIRNTSGDMAFDMYGFRSQLERAYASAGYKPTDDDDFGLLVDVVVRYSGQIQTNMESEYAFLGGAGGGIAGYRSNATAGTAIGAVAGATLGSIVGSFVTDDTYIIVTDVTYATIRDTSSSSPAKTVIFSRSTRTDDDGDKDNNRSQRGLKRSITTGVAVYAGGRNTPQSEIAGQVRERIARIVSNII